MFRGELLGNRLPDFLAAGEGGRVLRIPRRQWGFYKNPRAGQNFEKSISATVMGFLQKPAAGEKLEKSFLVTAMRFLKNPRAEDKSGKWILPTAGRF